MENSGGAAAEILFKPESVSVNNAESEGERESTTERTSQSPNGTSGENLTYDVRITSEGTRNSRANIYETDLSRALCTKSQDPSSNQGGVVVVTPFATSSYSDINEAKIGSTLKASGGSYGGGSENYVTEEHFTLSEQQGYRLALNPKVSVTLTGNGGGLGAKTGLYCVKGNENHYVVRKLSPLECERLQGLPDGYTDFGSDSARYKAIGNGMAQPCADFIMERVVEALRNG